MIYILSRVFLENQIMILFMFWSFVRNVFIGWTDPPCMVKREEIVFCPEDGWTENNKTKTLY